jgi:hypothetical protein
MYIRFSSFVFRRHKASVVSSTRPSGIPASIQAIISSTSERDRNGPAGAFCQKCLEKGRTSVPRASGVPMNISQARKILNRTGRADSCPGRKESQISTAHSTAQATLTHSHPHQLDWDCDGEKYRCEEAQVYLFPAPQRDGVPQLRPQSRLPSGNCPVRGKD